MLDRGSDLFADWRGRLRGRPKSRPGPDTDPYCKGNQNRLIFNKVVGDGALVSGVSGDDAEIAVETGL